MWKLTFAFVFLAFFNAPVFGDGPTCSQMGTGPEDMIMESSNGYSMNPKYQWDKKGGVVRVPIVIDHAYSHRERGIIFNGLQEIASKTCVKFAVHKGHHYLHGHDYVYISKTKSKGCWSYVGRVGTGKQDLSLPIGCINHRTVVHEVMHALGFSHEHVRQDRDNFVEILWDNIQRGRERNFEKKHGRADPFGPYDYRSIMHYEKNAFSSTGFATIRTLRGHHPIGTGKHMSHWDVVKINRMYKCNGGGYGGGSSPFFGFGGGFGDNPEGNDVDTDDDISFDNNEQPSPGAANEDDAENDVFAGIDNDPAFEGLFPESPSEEPRSSERRPPHIRGTFSRPPVSQVTIGGPLGTPDYDDSGPGVKNPLLGSPQHSTFPDNPFAKIPDNPFAPRLGLPHGVDETQPGLTAPAYYDTHPDVNKDFYNY